MEEPNGQGTTQKWDGPDLQRFAQMHESPCTHTRAACAGSLGDVCCSQLSRAGDWPGRNKQPIVSAQDTLSSQDVACAQTHGCFSLQKPWSHFTHARVSAKAPLSPLCTRSHPTRTHLLQVMSGAGTQPANVLHKLPVILLPAAHLPGTGTVRLHHTHPSSTTTSPTSPRLP